MFETMGENSAISPLMIGVIVGFASILAGVINNLGTFAGSALAMLGIVSIFLSGYIYYS